MENRSTEDQEMIREFLVESEENLSRLDQDLVELEKHPQDKSLLSSIFRTIHTIKGACGFLAFSKLESITHQAETLLSQLRDGKRELTPELVSLILRTVDATRHVLAAIEETGQEGEEAFEELTGRLRDAAKLPVAGESEPPAAQPAPAPVVQNAVAQPAPAAQPVPEAPPAPVAQPAASAAAEVPAPVERRSGEDRRKDEDRRQEGGGRREDDVERHSAAVDANIRVGVGLLDKLMDLVGELVLTRNQILQYNNEREDVSLNATSQRLDLITTELQEGVMKTRMQPIGVVWNKFPRVVRDMAFSLGKQIQLDMDGAETELDRTIIEAIKDPLMHLIRNSCDHGIEMPDVRARAGKSAQGRITLRAFHEGGQVNIEIGDDGGGIDIARVKQKAIDNGILRPEQADKIGDREALNLIFMPGFSTAQKVTNISGRGVGMDVVKSHIEKIGGVVDLFSRPGEGSTTKIRIPLTLAIIPGLVISSGGERFVIPQVSLLELIRIEADAVGNHIEHVHGTPVYRRRGSLLPLAYLNKVLALPLPEDNEAVNMVVLQAEDRQFGLVVDSINDTQEIVVKPLGKQLKGLTLYAGATIMGDGRVALILDVLGIGQRSGVFDEKREQARTQEEKQKTAQHGDVQRLLLFRAGSFERLAIPLSLVARLEEFSKSAIEHAAGGQVIQYRGGILPLVSLQAALEHGSYDFSKLSDPVQVVVFNDGDRSIGMMVDQIVDVVEESAKVSKKSGRKGILGSAVVGKKVTDFLDLNAIIEAAHGYWEQGGGVQSKGKNILVVDSSNFSRGMIRSALEIAGYEVVEAANAAEASHRLEQQPIDLVLLEQNLSPDGLEAFLATMLKNPDWRQIPVLGLAEDEAKANQLALRQSECSDWVSKHDQTQIVERVSGIVLPQVEEEAALVGAGEGK
jgi:two-component system chemotaxis sensor kinase CheA